ncbi:MAG: tRNA (adenosine(37)-N6)-threonylcarbamoyltransferase complex ATPase subunit type 1 TsaE [Candidatus Omnitrophica bacterium]|nr:tRNA (adenosine(37)-N6)-threonylcarbamoyltransferase complex ATPase subunit type 1 TsaE [Candidatus Omnitrophota bacterium]
MGIISNSVWDTIKIGKTIAHQLQEADIICLFGQLGSGKTVLVKGIARGLGIRNKTIISPTFVLLRQYVTGKIALNHFDLYRLKAPKEILSLGYEDYLYDHAVSVIEWADRLKYLLPKEYLKIELIIKGKNKRLIKFSAYGNRYKKLLAKIYELRPFCKKNHLVIKGRYGV